MMDRGRILVVDDSEDSCAVVAEALRLEGYVVDTAPDGASALRYLGKRSADLVLTDYRMPDMDGVELTRKIHASQPGQRVVLMTGFESDASFRAVTRSIRKPMDVQDLLWIVDCALACRSTTSLGGLS